ncbi:hypothetical protein PHLGIDRAFT_120505 [Phlebiopsis gigantea 11061_1 CR5-6]|uniref:Uncharacterized protein n=1 Tax=Phlebiopsis gigantea (strain 11061_1 CR5-6) TaxID=745531 RepID=A0A0C3S3X0_PHLG1|nr:hypothetical protein PHLGIDRAFT_120505 [Phlebiopsis gigantea 11061_1 CR5-6]
MEDNLDLDTSHHLPSSPYFSDADFALDAESDLDNLAVNLALIYDQDDENTDDILLSDDLSPPAFSEDPIIRNIYIRVFLDVAFNHATHASVKTQLSSHRSALLASNESGRHPIEGLDTMACTLRTLERRLGVDPDQFCPMKSGTHSSGAIYITILNNPRERRFRREETILVCMIPGPNEPSKEELNFVLEPLAQELLKLSREFVLRDDWRFIKYAFRSRDAPDQATREEIVEERGKRYSAFDILPGWLPGRCSVLDNAHAVFLGEVRHEVQGILGEGGMFTTCSRKHNPAERLEEYLASIWWPASVGRLPSKVLKGTLKADQWRNLAIVLPVALFYAWAVDDEIPDEDAPRPRRKTKAAQANQRKEDLLKKRRLKDLAMDPKTKPADLIAAAAMKMSRNYREHYANVLEHCTCVRIWASRSITPEEARRAQECHGRACRAWARMQCHLLPNFHLSEHNEPTILRMGPIYVFWTFPTEQHNGFLKKFRLNYHTGGELEGTMMRGWVKYTLIYELILHMEAIEIPTLDDQRTLALMKKHLAGGDPGARHRGTLELLLAAFSAAEGRLSRALLPRQTTAVDLAKTPYYTPIFEYLRCRWQDDVTLVPPTAPVDAGEAFLGRRSRSLAYITVDGLRYGASTSARGAGFQYAFINGQKDTLALQMAVAIVQRFRCTGLPSKMPPWASRALDLGIAMWDAGQYEDEEVIDVLAFSGHLSHAPLKYRGKHFWVTFSLDHTGQEPEEYEDENDAADM